MTKKRTGSAGRLISLSTGRSNQRLGQHFEAYIAFAAMREGLLCIQQGLKAKRLATKVLVQRSNLDFFLAGDATKGEVAYLDAKSFSGPRFGRSQLEMHQIERALRYEAHGIASGFVVLFRDSRQVVYFSASLLTAKVGRAGFCVEDGLLLGGRDRFSLSLIWGSTPGHVALPGHHLRDRERTN